MMQEVDYTPFRAVLLLQLAALILVSAIPSLVCLIVNSFSMKGVGSVF